MRNHFVWRHMANHVHTMVEYCRSCAQGYATWSIYVKLDYSQLLDHLDSCPLIYGNHYLIQFRVLTHGYFDDPLFKAHPCNCHRENTLTDLATILIDNWILLNGIPNFILMKNGPSLSANFSRFYAFSQPIGRWLQQSIVLRQAFKSRNISTHESQDFFIMFLSIRMIGDTNEPPLTFPYSIQTHRVKGTSSFNVTLPCTPPSAATFDRITTTQAIWKEKWQSDKCYICCYNRLLW